MQAFDPGIKFVILIHPIEFRKRIATGKMAHLSLKNSELIRGHDYSDNERVNGILADPANYCVMLYPGPTSTNLTLQTNDERASLFPTDKKLVIFVIDGTWLSAKKTVHLSQNLKVLPKVCFVPVKTSNFRVRKQPAPECYSTIEAIHHVIELMGTSTEHGILLELFDRMVTQQLELQKNLKYRRRLCRPPGQMKAVRAGL